MEQTSANASDRLHIRLRNFRSFSDSGQLELRPITLFLGRNSSGKSTLARFLPLLRQSVETRSRSPIVWYGDLVDFGDFATTLRRGAQDGQLTYELRGGEQYLPLPRPRDYFWSPGRETLKVPVAIGVALSADDNSETQLRSVRLQLGSDVVEIEPNSGRIGSMSINGQSMAHVIPPDGYLLTNSSVVPSIEYPGRPRDDGLFWAGNRDEPWNGLARKELARLIGLSIGHALSAKTIRGYASTLEYQPDREGFIKSFRRGSQANWTRYVQRIEAGQENVEPLRNLALFCYLPKALRALTQNVEQFLRGVGYVGPTRASGARYVRKRELRVSSISPAGENLGEFLTSLDRASAQRLNDWIGPLIQRQVTTKLSSGHIATEISGVGEPSWFNLADVGFGYSQLLPILVQLWLFSDTRANEPGVSAPTAFVVEQPELHLHPAFQAKIADALAKAANDTKGKRVMLIETHSQQLVNRLGAIIQQQGLSADWVALYVFEQDERGESSVRRASFGSEGELVDWPFGFFTPDESDY